MEFSPAIANSSTASGADTGQPQLPAIMEGSTETFQRDVIDASRDIPVLVDFWAPWCGPCRQLGPALEKVTNESSGRLRLVKINVDENQRLAGQMGIQSIPAVFAFVDGRPVDGFMGALPESEVRNFAEKILASAPPAIDESAARIDEALAEAATRAANGDFAAAAEIYASVHAFAPTNETAILGLAEAMLKGGDLDNAEALLSELSEEKRTLPQYLALVTAIALQRQGADLPPLAALNAAIESDPDNLDARFDLALALNTNGQRLEAAEVLVALMRLDREWKEDAARLRLLEFFEAWGAKDPATIKGRRLLSAALFA